MGREQQQQRVYQKRHEEQQQWRSSSSSSKNSYEKMMEHAASAHEYAQKLNNISAMYMEVGKYDKAIESLGKALKLSEIHTTDQLLDRSEACTCCDCSLEGCIAHSEQGLNLIEVFDTSINNNKNESRKGVMDIDEECATLYRKPIRIPKRSICEGHNMGSTLFLIITFNLALAHHLKALKKTSDSLLISSIVQFYELANNWQNLQSNYETDDYEDDTINSMEEDDEAANSK